MCLGIPAHIVDIVDADQALATVEISGVQRVVSTSLLTDEQVKPGDWVLVHVGFAMATIDPQEAAETLALLAEIGQAYQDELDAYSASDV